MPALELKAAVVRGVRRRRKFLIVANDTSMIKFCGTIIRGAFGGSWSF